MEIYDWKTVDQFVNRTDDLARLEDWWSRRTRDAMTLIGRRRVGKSWLFRRFAHGKPSVVLVADELLLATQMTRFATELEPFFGVRPEIDGVASLIRLLYQLGSEDKILAIIDEFPFLLPEGSARDGVLTEIQAVMEEHRDQSKTKLVLCGSLIGQMEGLLHTKSPLHGRLQPLDIRPLTFAEGNEMTDSGDSAEQRIVRFAIAGGMARYLDELGHGPIQQAVCQRVLDRRGPLFNDPRVVLEQELRSPATYLSILTELSANPAKTEHLTEKLQVDSSTLAPYLETLREMRLITTAKPVGAPATSRSAKHAVSDGFIRFWFRFVFPNQDGLQTGLGADDLWAAEIEPYLPDFIAPAFEELCVRYTRITYGAEAPLVGGWWGNALNKERRNKRRWVEEIDVAAAQSRNLKIVGECKWTRGLMQKSVLDDLYEFKIPAIKQEKHLKVPVDGPRILLFARTGFDRALIKATQDAKRVTLVDLETMIAGLDSESPASR